MQTLVFESALLPDGWADDVAVRIDDDGNISGVIAAVDESGEGWARGCALPGIPNLHSHAHQRALAGLAERSGPDEDSFWTWRETMYRYVGRMGPEQLEAVASQLYIEMLKAGYTAVAEFQYLHHDPDGSHYDDPAEMTLRTVAAARTAGIGLTALPVLYRYGGFGGREPAEGQRRFICEVNDFLEILARVQAAAAGDSNLAVGIAPHSLRAVTPEILETLLSELGDDTGPIHIHVAEQQAEVDECLQWSGQRPVEWLLTECEVDASWCLIHATHMTGGETRALADTGAVAGLCPTTEANLGDGVFQAAEFMAAGGRFGIGSDSHISISPVEELRWLEYGQRLERGTRNVLAGRPGRSTGRHLFEKAVAGGAAACGRPIGRIEAGCRADLITLDTDHPVLAGRSGDDLLDSWIFSGNVPLVRDVWVGGKQVIADGRHPAEDLTARDFRRTLAQLSNQSSPAT